MPTEKNGNYQSSLKGGGVPPYWQNANIFPVFSYEGFPKPTGFSLVNNVCIIAEYTVRQWVYIYYLPKLSWYQSDTMEDRSMREVTPYTLEAFLGFLTF